MDFLLFLNLILALDFSFFVKSCKVSITHIVGSGTNYVP